ncbi:hypothetical protein EGW08_014261, partial [Elysia chlorotica]
MMKGEVNVDSVHSCKEGGWRTLHPASLHLPFIAAAVLVLSCSGLELSLESDAPPYIGGGAQGSKFDHTKRDQSRLYLQLFLRASQVNSFLCKLFSCVSLSLSLCLSHTHTLTTHTLTKCKHCCLLICKNHKSEINCFYITYHT